MASVDDGSDVPISPMPGISSNYGSPNGSSPDLDGMGPRSFGAQFKELRDMLSPLARGFADFDKQVKILFEPWRLSPPELPALNRPSNPSLPRLRCLQHWNRTTTPFSVSFVQVVEVAEITPSEHSLRRIGGTTAPPLDHHSCQNRISVERASTTLRSAQMCAKRLCQISKHRAPVMGTLFSVLSATSLRDGSRAREHQR